MPQTDYNKAAGLVLAMFGFAIFGLLTAIGLVLWVVHWVLHQVTIL